MSKIKFILLAVIMGGLMLGSYLAMALSGMPTADVFAATTIVVDGGGDIGNFNTTFSMEQSASNPFPYNTLEVLCKEWQELPGNEDFTVVVSQTSHAGAVGSLRPLLSAGTAPDIIYCNGTVAEEDKDKGWYVELGNERTQTGYLYEDNPYTEEEDMWADIWDSTEVSGVSDGRRFNVMMERLPIGIICNETLLKQAGYTGNLNTLTEFMEAQRVCKQNLSSGIATYLTPYRWYDIQLETNLFGYLIEELDGSGNPKWDTDGNGQISLSELIAMYDAGAWKVDSDRFKVYLQLVQLRTKYYPADYANRTALNEFVAGKCVFIEGLGSELRKIAVNNSITFDYKMYAYPSVSVADLQNIGIDSALIQSAGINADTLKGSRGGTAGYGTSWWVTNTAQNKGQATVDKCVDLLQFLTTGEINDRMIGDLGGSIPLNPTEQMINDAGKEGAVIKGYLKEIATRYFQDLQDTRLKGWGVFNSWNALGTEFSTSFLTLTGNYIKDVLGKGSGDFNGLVNTLKSTAAAVIAEKRS